MSAATALKSYDHERGDARTSGVICSNRGRPGDGAFLGAQHRRL